MGKCMDVILARRTIRRFKQEPIARKDLMELVNAGRLASSAGNGQPWEFIVVDEKGLVDDLYASLGWLAGAPDENQRPTALIAVLLSNPKDRWTAHADGAAAIQNMELAAWEKGIGACWVGAKDNETLCQLLRIPESLQLFSVLALGIPDEAPVVEDADDDVSAKRDADGRLHVKKRKLDAICHVNRYGEKK